MNDKKRYLKQHIKKCLKNIKKINPENAKLLESFLAEKQVHTGLGIRSTYARIAELITEHLDGKTFTEITRQDAVEFLNFLKSNYNRSCQSNYIGWFRGFMKSVYKVLEKKPPKWVKDDDLFKRKRHKKKIKENDLISVEECEKIINATTTPRDALVISILWETGAKISEVLDLKVGSIEPNGIDSFIIKMPNKKYDTKNTRSIIVKECTPRLREYLNYHPHKNDPEAWLFLKIDENGKLTYFQFLKRLKKAIKRTGIKKHIHPHLFRHTRLTIWARIYTEQVLKALANWSPSSDMAEVYVHFAEKDLIKQQMKQYGLLHENEKEEEKTIVELKTVICPNCQEKTLHNTDFACIVIL